MNKLQHLQYLGKLGNQGARITDVLYNLPTKPALDLNFARNKSLMDNVTRSNLITFSRASSATYVDSTGTLRTAATNLLVRSEEFQTTWSNIGSSENVNVATSPNNTLTADALVDTTVNEQHNIAQSVTGLTGNTAYTFSCFFKKGSKDFAALVFGPNASWGTGSGATAYINLTNGTLTTSSGLTGTPVIEAFPNGWYRLSATATTVASPGTVSVRVAASLTGTTQTYTGNADEAIYIWGAQLEVGTSVTSYIPTTSTTSNAPRFDHNPTTGESLGLLVEEQRTNDIRNNTMQGAVAGTPGTLPTNWTGSTTTAGVSREIIGTGTESGIAYVDIKASGTTTGLLFFVIRAETATSIPAANLQTWAHSSYVKLVAGSLANATIKFGLQGNDNTGTAIAFPPNLIIAPTTGSLISQRATNVGVFNTVGIAHVQPYIQIEAASGVAIDITLRIGLPQLEQGAFATSVIPTSTTAVTRSADVASITGTNFSSWYRQDEGTMFANARVNATYGGVNSFPRILAINDESNNNTIENYYRVLSPYTDAGYLVNASGVVQAQVDTNDARNGQSSAIGYAANNFALVIGGTIANLDTSGTVPTVTELRIGNRADGNNALNGTIRRLTYWPARLSDANLQRITQ